MLEIKVLPLQLKRALSSKSMVFMRHLSSLSNVTAEELNSWQTNHHSHSHWAELLLIYVRAKRLSETVRVGYWDMQVGDCSWPLSETVYHHHYQYQHRPRGSVRTWLGIRWLCELQLPRGEWIGSAWTIWWIPLLWLSPKPYSTSEWRVTLLLLILSYSVFKTHGATTTGGMGKRGPVLLWQMDLYFSV